MTEEEAFSTITRELRQKLYRMFRDNTPTLTAATRRSLNAICQSALKDIQRLGYYHDFKVEVKPDPRDPAKLNINFMPPPGWMPVRFEGT